MNRPKTLLCVVALTIFIPTSAQADEYRDADVTIDNDTNSQLELTITIKKSRSFRNGQTYTWQIAPNSSYNLWAGGHCLRASSISYSVKKPNGTRAPGDPTLVFVKQSNRSDVMDIKIQRDQEFRHPTASELRHLREIDKIRTGFEIDVMKAINEAWNF